MQYKTMFIAALVVILTACNNTDKQASNKEEVGTTKTTEPFEPAVTLIPVQPQDKPESGQYCIIKKIFTEGDTTYAEVDYVDFFMGDAAIAAAKKHGDADAVQDDYYIVNDNKQLRTLSLAKKVEVLLISEDSTSSPAEPGIEMLMKRADSNGLFILTIENSMVKKIKQQYLP
jgi:hypothetical protein